MQEFSQNANSSTGGWLGDRTGIFTRQWFTYLNLNFFEDVLGILTLHSMRWVDVNSLGMFFFLGTILKYQS